MTVPTSAASNPALVAALEARLGEADTVLIFGEGASALAAALSTDARRCAVWSDDETDEVAAAVCLDAATASPVPTLGRVLDRVRPGGELLWASPSARSAARLRAALRLAKASPGPASTSGAAGRLEAAGAQILSTDVIPAEPQSAADLAPILLAVREAGGDADALARDWERSHELITARVPRRRQRRGDASELALRSAVEGAVAAGADLGRRTAASADAEEMGLEPPRVSVIVPVYNGAAFTEKCLYAIAASSLRL